MRPFVLDTNLYILAARDDAWNRDLEAFSTAFAPWLHMHSVVAMELLAGAMSPWLRRRTESSFIAPFERRRRVITPSARSWKRAGSIIAELVGRRRLSANGIARSFIGDCLIAATAAEHGFVLVTRNVRDFELIGDVEEFEWVEPWPEA